MGLLDVVPSTCALLSLLSSRVATILRAPIFGLSLASIIEPAAHVQILGSRSIQLFEWRWTTCFYNFCWQMQI
jgi:hypothetical protein